MRPSRLYRAIVGLGLSFAVTPWAAPLLTGCTSDDEGPSIDAPLNTIADAPFGTIADAALPPDAAPDAPLNTIADAPNFDASS